MASEYLKWKCRDVKPDEKVELTQQQRRRNWRYYYKWHGLLWQSSPCVKKSRDKAALYSPLHSAGGEAVSFITGTLLLIF